MDDSSKKTIYQRMLEERFYLYRPWIPICKSIEAKVIKSLELIPPVLDIGCGNGLFASFSFNQKIDTGLDYDKNAVEEAKKRGVYNEVRLGDAQALPLKKDTFNTVVSVCAIEHIPGLNDVLSNAHKVLKDGGRFIFTVPSEEFGESLFGARLYRFLGARRLAKRFAETKNRKSGHIHIYSPAGWEETLRGQGFRVESIDYIFPKEAVFLWSFFHSLPFRIIFLPFRLFRDLNIKAVDNILRFALKALLSGWVEKRSGRYASGGGYLLIIAKKYRTD
ncbi:MAG: class I SAM-dependent methyltransferase [Candidatus Omnitrophica bacterium]|nr:class I SAM-dependent methyltransferase [Candidatus Omnitrophota bacterium]